MQRQELETKRFESETKSKASVTKCSESLTSRLESRALEPAAAHHSGQPGGRRRDAAARDLDAMALSLQVITRRLDSMRRFEAGRTARKFECDDV